MIENLSVKEIRISWGNGTIAMNVRPSTQMPGALRVHTITTNGHETSIITAQQTGKSFLITPGKEVTFGRGIKSRRYAILSSGGIFYINKDMTAFIHVSAAPEKFEPTRTLVNRDHGRLSIQTLIKASETTVDDGLNPEVILMPGKEHAVQFDINKLMPANSSLHEEQNLEHSSVVGVS